jgi:hypothetical protein
LAKTKTKPKGPTVPTMDDGNPDIYSMVHDQDMTIVEAAEVAGIAAPKGYKLYWAGEVEHNPELRIKIKDRAKLAARIVRERDVDKTRWERLQVRTGLSRAELEELYEESKGEPPKKLRGFAADDEDEAPAPRKSKANGGKSKAKAAPEPEDEDEDDEDEDDEDEEEVPKSRSARRAKARK